MKNIFKFLFVFLITVTSCEKVDLGPLQNQIEDLEDRTAELEAQMKAHSELLKAQSEKLYVLSIDEKADGLELLMSDGSKIFVPSKKSITPYVGENGNWWVDGQDTGVRAEAKDGANGSNGADGTNGLTPYIGENGNWFIGDTDTGVPAEGKNGANGSDGTNGNNGENGVTPHIGENGNWFIGDTDTGVPAEGKDGANGNDGINGNDGADGINGLTPYIGENGNWFIGDIDTGVAAAGIDGANGSDGVDGTNGVDGTDAPKIISIQYINNEVVFFFNDNTSIKLQMENKEELENQKNWKAVKTENGYVLIKYNGTDTDIVVPNTLYGEPVVGIGVEGATSVDYSVIPLEMRLLVNSIDISNCESLTTIENYAFAGLSKINEITLPASLLELKEGSFADAAQLTTVNVLRNSEPYTSCDLNCFNNSPIKDGTNGAKIIYPANTKYHLTDSWTENNAEHIDVNGDSIFNYELGTVLTEGDWTGIVINGGIRITDYSGLETDVILPNTLAKLKVTAVGKDINYSDNTTLISIFSAPENITSVTLSKDIISVGPYAFSYCSNLTEVNMPSTLEFIGNSAFFRCKSLINVTLPENLNEMRGDAFRECSSLKEIEIPASLTHIPSLAFRECTNLETVTLNEGLIEIGHMSFMFCPNLNNVELPQSVEKISDFAFYECENFTEIVLPENLTWIGSHAFDGCNKVTDLIIPQKVELIRQNAFADCTNLERIEIKSGAVIQFLAFNNCSNLTSVTISNNSETLTSLTTTLTNGTYANCFYRTPISLGTNNATIYYPSGTDYQNLEVWKDLQANWVAQ